MDTIAKSVFKNRSGEKSTSTSSGSTLEEMGIDIEELPEKLRAIEEKYIVNILHEIIYEGKKVTWDDIAGLAYAKKCVMEAIIWPMQRPDLFTGLRTVPRGISFFILIQSLSFTLIHSQSHSLSFTLIHSHSLSFTLNHIHSHSHSLTL